MNLRICKGQVWVGTALTRRVDRLDGVFVHYRAINNLSGSYTDTSCKLKFFLFHLRSDNAKLDKRSVINQFFNGD